MRTALRMPLLPYCVGLGVCHHPHRETLSSALSQRLDEESSYDIRVAGFGGFLAIGFVVAVIVVISFLTFMVELLTASSMSRR